MCSGVVCVMIIILEALEVATPSGRRDEERWHSLSVTPAPSQAQEVEREHSTFIHELTFENLKYLTSVKLSKEPNIGLSILFCWD